MKTLAFLFTFFLLAFPALARPLHVGLAIPQSGPFAPLGDHVREAFDLWTAHNPGVFADVVEGEDHCDATSGADAASAFSEAGVDVVVGFFCTESLMAALPALSSEGIPVITLSVRADIIAEEARRMGWSFFRLAPQASDEVQVTADTILTLWADQPFAIIEDGTIRGRELAEAVRISLEMRGLKASFIDHYRPGQRHQPSLIRRLKAAGITRVFIGGDRSDIAIIARDAREAGLELGLMAGDALHAPVGELDIPEDTLGIIAGTNLPGAASDQARVVFSKAGVQLEGLRLPAYAAADILGSLANRLSYNEGSVADILRSQTFRTAIGPVSFDGDGERNEPGFSLAIWRDGRFQPTSPAQVNARMSANRKPSQ